MGRAEIDIIGGTFVRKDKLGRRNRGWLKAGPGRKKLNEAALSFQINVRMDKELYNRINKLKHRSQKIREYIEWGLENDK